MRDELFKSLKFATSNELGMRGKGIFEGGLEVFEELLGERKCPFVATKTHPRSG